MDVLLCDPVEPGYVQEMADVEWAWGPVMKRLINLGCVRESETTLPSWDSRPNAEVSGSLRAGLGWGAG